MIKTKYSKGREAAIWIIYFTDGTCGSSCGTRENAKEFAELKKDLYGGDYIIKESELLTNCKHLGGD